MSRITYIFPSTKTVGLSELQNLVDNKAFIFQEFSTGDVIEEATALRLDQGKGLLLQLSENVTGYAHVSTGRPFKLFIYIYGIYIYIYMGKKQSKLIFNE